MADNWELVISRLRSEMPLRVAVVEREARAGHLRYRSSLAYAGGDFAASRRLLWQAVTHGSLAIFGDRRTWFTMVAAIGSMLPARFHRVLAAAAMRARARFVAKHSGLGFGAVR